jgi:XTP/dITP diphosphohydrolase
VGQLVTIRRFRDLPAAHIALGKLESAGITCELADDEMVRMDWFYSNMVGGVRLQVAEDEVEDAEKVLAELPPVSLGPEGVGSQYTQPICPNCGSVDVFHENRPTAVSYAALVFLALPIVSGVDRMKCNACGATWEPFSDTVAEDGQTDTTVYVATSNKGKLREFRKAAEAVNVIIEPLPTLDEIEPPAETGKTFDENARIKAEAYSRTLPAHLVFADDSGLEVKVLNGEPGVYSARYAATKDSPDPSDDDNNYKLIYELSQRPSADRDARFVCVIAIAKDGETLGTFRGSVDGEILQAPLGKGGFGYDPLFLIPALNKTMAELDEETKFAISHRGNAFRAMLRWLEEKGLVSPSSPADRDQASP